mmetsp:Transcript_17909/g.37444  ORF Transcript_17909/g.37444 Transcript_17909/m.37444 type:complete len:151 (+) Transcript_17909:682-1134(+)
MWVSYSFFALSCLERRIMERALCWSRTARESELYFGVRPADAGGTSADAVASIHKKVAARARQELMVLQPGASLLRRSWLGRSNDLLQGVHAQGLGRGEGWPGSQARGIRSEWWWHARDEWVEALSSRWSSVSSGALIRGGRGGGGLEVD